MLEIEGLTVRFDGVEALAGLTLTVPRGARVGVIGPNGSGKTTLFNAISGLVAIADGTIRLDGRTISHLAPHQIAASGVARTFQIPRPFAEMTVLENMLTGAQSQAGERAWMNFARPGRAAAEEWAAVARRYWERGSTLGLHGRRGRRLPFEVVEPVAEAFRGTLL